MGAETNEKHELYRDMWGVVKFYCLKGKILTKIFEQMISVYSNDCLSQMQMFALQKEFLDRRKTIELCNSQCSGWPPTLSTETNVNIARTLIEEDCSLLSRDDSHNGLIKVDDWKHYEKIWYVPHCFNVGPTSFNETATSIMWHLHSFEKQVSRGSITHSCAPLLIPVITHSCAPLLIPVSSHGMKPGPIIITPK